MRILGIDPGPKDLNWVLLVDGQPRQFGTCVPIGMVWEIRDFLLPDVIAIEWIHCQGQVVGSEVFETCRMVGLFEGALRMYVTTHLTQDVYGDVRLIPRHAVKLELCGRSCGKDANVRRAIIERFGGDDAVRPAKSCRSKRKDHTGCAHCGGTRLERQPGVLSWISGHHWAALAVALTALETDS